MKLTNIKLKVETDEENQYVLQKHIELNKECEWVVTLYNGDDYWSTHNLDTSRAVCSVWKGFRYLVIDSDGDLILCDFEGYYTERAEKEISFDEFKEMFEPKQTLIQTHPSLKGLSRIWEDMCVEVVSTKNIQNHTIDKTVLRDKINQMLPSRLMCSGNPNLVMLRQHLNELKHSLGLEKE